MLVETNGIQVPEHLIVPEFYRQIVQNGLKICGIVDIQKITFTIGSSGGDNYCSDIFRCLINYDNNGNNAEISVIIKNVTLAVHSERYLQMFRKEVKIYTDILPEMETILEKHLAPKLLYHSESPACSMVFEDLNCMGFELRDRINGLNEMDSIICMKQIGQFHAASMVLTKKNPQIMDWFNVSLFHTDHDLNTPSEVTRNQLKAKILTGNISYIANMIREWPGFELIAKKLVKIEDNFLGKCLAVINSGLNKNSVLNHGDLWVNNCMFQKDGSNSVRFIDYQLCYWGSLGIDLQYFLNTSVQIDVLINKRDQLLNLYYTELRCTLEKLQYSDIPSWENIEHEINAMELYGFFALEAMLPIMSLDRITSKDNSFQTYNNPEKSHRNKQIAFGTERLQQSLRYQLKRFNDFGLFDRIIF